MTMHTAYRIAAVDRFAEARVLCVGDAMLDRFVYGGVERISPEAPIPVVLYDHETVMLGGAGNVLRNLVSLGASAGFVTVVGGDDAGRMITRLTGEQLRVTPYLITDRHRRSTEKTRYIAGNQQMFRTDKEDPAPIDTATGEKILAAVEQALPDADIVVLSDYGKGVLSEDRTRHIIALAARHGKRVAVDPKARDFSRYRGAWLLTPNLKELTAACGKEVKGAEEISEAARAEMRRCSIDAMIVTLGSRGMLVVSGDGDALHLPAQKREVFDVSGAGDTVIATLAAGLATGLELEEAAFLANTAAGIVVGRTGTATVYRTDLKTAVHTQDTASGIAKIYPLDLAADQAESWRREGLRVGFTNGCFDLIHPGHLALLADAKAQCDRLVVAVNGDASVKRLKGDSRPVNGEMERALLLAELRAVDMVVLFREDTPEETLRRLKPDLLMKGGDYTPDQVVGRDFVESYGGRVLLLPLREGYSTTATIAKIKGRG